MKTIQIGTPPALYVGTYAKYNAGSIKGAWLSLADYPDQASFLEAARALHDDEEDPELMFQDYEGFPSSWYCESAPPGAILWDWLKLGGRDGEAFALYAEHIGDGASLSGFEDAYAGTFDSEADFAEDLADSTGAEHTNLPSWICIDWQATWMSALRFDYFCDRDSEDTLHFFRNT